MAQVNQIYRLTEEEFDQIRSIVRREIGINLSAAKKKLVISRLAKRLRMLNLPSYGDYLQLVLNNQQELTTMLNLITTNVSKFFREPYHFQFLCQQYLPSVEARAATDGGKKIRAWSAACASGQEPYTLAMVLHDYFTGKKGWEIQILASDVNTETLAKASRGIYSYREVEDIPYQTLKKYFKLGTGANKNLFQVKETVRQLITFRQINLVDSSREYPIDQPLDLIFCRNVFIYFDKDTQARILQRFYRHLRPGGWLFLGHSESIPSTDQGDKWRLHQHTIYQRMP